MRAVQTSDGEIKADLAVVCTHKEPNNALGVAAGLKIGSTGGLIVDERMATSAPGVFAAGDCTEIPHGLTGVPLQGLTGSHAYAQGKTAGINAGGGVADLQRGLRAVGHRGRASGSSAVRRSARPRRPRWASRTWWAARRASRARATTPGVKPVKVKLLAEPGSLRLIGAQMVGGEGIKERADTVPRASRI